MTVTAATISRHAAEQKAGRVCFFGAGKYFFCGTDASSISSIVESHDVDRYKLQVARDGKWIDASQYVDISPLGHVINAIRRTDSQALSAIPHSTKARAAAKKPRDFSHAVAHLHRRGIEAFSRAPSSSALAEEYEVITELADVDTPLVQYAAANLLAHRTVAGVDASTTSDPEAALPKLEALRGSGGRHVESKTASIPLAVLRGKYLSLDNRSAAEQEFKYATLNDTDNVIKSAFIDLGAWSYYSEATVKASSAPDFAARVRASAEWADHRAPASERTIAVSVDPAFFRIYGPRLMLLAQQLPDIDFTFILCGRGRALKEAREDAEAFRKALFTFNQSGEPDNLRYMTMPVPDEVTEAETFYACARLFAIDSLLHRYRQVYLMDADLDTDSDPRPYLNLLKDVPFGAPLTKGFLALSPWRRYMAGNLPFNREAIKDGLLADVQEYIAYWLTRQNSWMLDQNALAYGIERHPEAYTDLNQFKRPFKQPSFRSVWERSYRVANRVAVT